MREECEYLSGLLYTGDSDERTECRLSKLKTERKKLRRKVCNIRCSIPPYLSGTFIWPFPPLDCSLVVSFVFLLKQVIFRSDPNKYQNLRRALDEFAGFLTRPISLVKDIDKLDWNQVVEQVFNWQETATSFIDRLSSDYSEYVDITQPIQVSVYEMKLGLSLFVSGTLLGKILSRFDVDTVDSVMVHNLLSKMFVHFISCTK